MLRVVIFTIISGSKKSLVANKEVKDEMINYSVGLGAKEPTVEPGEHPSKEQIDGEAEDTGVRCRYLRLTCTEEKL